MNDKEALVTDIEQDYKKLSNECKKKYNTIREVIEISIKAFEKLKSVLISKDSSLELFHSELALSIEIILKPIALITESKHIKLLPHCAIILQKLITYSFITTKVSNNVIVMLKDIFDNSLEDTHYKVLSSILSMINANSIEIEEETVNNIMIISCKIFAFKNSEFKNPIRSLFKTLIEKVFESISRAMKFPQKEKEDGNVKSNEELKSELKASKKYSCGVSLIKSLTDISDGKKKEWIAPTMYSKCLGIELLASLILTQSNARLFIEIDDFNSLIKNELCKTISRAFATTNDYFIGMKLVRISLIIIKHINTDQELIQNILRYAERESLVWQKILGLEGLNSIFQDYSLVISIYKNNFPLYEELLNSLTEIAYKNVVKKCNESPIRKKEERHKIAHDQHIFSQKTKLIENSSIITDGETITIPLSNSYLYKLLTDCYVNLRNAFIYIMEENGLLLNQINSTLSKEQNEIKEMLNFKYVTIKGALVGLLLNSSDDGITQTYLNLFQSFISIYASIALPNVRDEYLNALCKLAIPNNLENTLEMKEKNILIARTLFNIAHCVNLLDYSSWILLLETMQNLYLMLINSNNYIIKPGGEEFDIEIVIKNLEMNIKKYSYDTPSSEIKEMVKEIEVKNINNNEHISNQQVSPLGIIQKKKTTPFSQIEKKRQMTNEERDNIIILSTAIDTLFIDSVSYDKTTIANVSKALYQIIKNIINGISSSNNSNDTAIIYLHFNLTKLLDIGMINYSRIEIVWDEVVQMIALISNTNLLSISKFCLDVISEIILFVLSHYQPSPEQGSELWNRKAWQKTIMTPYLTTILSATPNQFLDVINHVLRNVVKLIEKCGVLLNSIGWSFIIEICSSLLSKADLNQSENIFKLIEQIFNEYSSYLTLYNIMPLVAILGKFSLFKLNSNICYSSISLFWSCATIIENFQRGKVALTQSQNEIFIEDLPDIGKQDAFFNDLWRAIFQTLTLIYSDTRFEVRKSGLSIFAEIFAAKISNITEETSLLVIEKNFFEIMNNNNQTYEEKASKAATSASASTATQQHHHSGEEKEWEETIMIGIQATGKAIKAFLIDKQSSNRKSSIVIEMMSKCIKIISISTPDIGMQILKFIDEIHNTDPNIINDPSFTRSYWKIYEEFGLYLSSELFIKKYSTFIVGSKLFNSILNNLRSLFVKSNKVSSLFSKESIDFFFGFIKKIIECAKYTEGNTINSNPQKVLNNEKEVFDFIDEITKATSSQEELNALYAFVCNFISYDELTPHSEAYCRRGLESIGVIFMNESFDYKPSLSDIIEKCKALILLRGNKTSVIKIFECNKSQLLFWQYISSELIKLLQSIISKLTDASTFEIIISCFEEIFKQSEVGYKSIPANYQEDLAKSCQEMDIQIINFIVNDLIPNSFYISSHLQTKLLILLDMGSNIDYSFINSYFSIRKMCISNLFDLCMFKTEDEIKKDKKSLLNAKHIDDYYKIKVKIAKMCTPILIKRCRVIIKKYLEDEVKSGAMPLARARLEEIKFVLEKIKNLEVYPNFNSIDSSDEDKNKDDEQLNQNEENESRNDIMKVVIKTKKAHLFLLHSLLADFIISKENDIKMIIKDIFKSISLLMGISDNSDI